MAKLNVDKLLKLEVRRVEALYRLWAQQVGNKVPGIPDREAPSIRHFSIPNFVEASFEAHRPLVEAWGGWRLHGPVTQVLEVPNVVLVWQKIQEEMLSQRKWNTTVGRHVLGYAMVKLRYYNAKLNFDDVKRRIGDLSGPMEENWGKLLGERVIVERHARGGYKLFLYIPTGQEALCIPVRVGQSISRAILGELEEFSKKFPESPYIQVASVIYNELFTRMGAASSSVPFATTLSVAPSSFLRLGEYGEKSCYRNGGESELAKHGLALTPHSVVGLFYRSKKREELEVNKEGRRLGKAAGRCWGFYSPNGLYTTNYYLIGAEMAASAIAELVTQYCEGKSTAKLCEKATQLIHSRHSQVFYVNGDPVTHHATEPFLTELGKSMEFIASWWTTRERWVDPCCTKKDRSKMLTHLRQLVTEEPQQNREQPLPYEYGAMLPYPVPHGIRIYGADHYVYQYNANVPEWVRVVA